MQKNCRLVGERGIELDFTKATRTSAEYALDATAIEDTIWPKTLGVAVKHSA